MVELLFKWLAFAAYILIPRHQSPGVLGDARGGAMLHPFYVSVTEIAHNGKENTVEISCKMFADDLENTLRTQYKTDVDLTNPRDRKQAEKMVNDYLLKHLKLTINAKPVALQFVGYEKESEAVWGYLQVNDINSVKKLEVTDTILYEIFSSQISIVHASVNGNRKSLRLINPDANASFDF